MTNSLDAVNNLLINSGPEIEDLADSLAKNEVIFSCAVYYCGKKSSVGMGATNLIGEFFNNTYGIAKKAIERNYFGQVQAALYSGAMMG
jgi:hypothetical protein